MNGIRLAKLSDTSDVMDFIKVNWNETHILARDKKFFLYQHKDKHILNYVISVEDNKINGLLGFIKYSNIVSDIAIVIWKVKNNNKKPMLGIELLEFLRNHKKYNILFSSGIDKKTIGIYNYLNIYINQLSQYVIINNEIESFNIVKFGKKVCLNKVDFIDNDDFKLIELNEIPLDFCFHENNFIPYKDRSYFLKRFFDHPIYNYKIYGICIEGIIKSLIVTRVISLDGSQVLRIMDFIGDENHITFITKYLYELIITNNYEYVDFVCFGFDEKNLKKAGFKKIDLKSSDIITPNYFSPFLRKNVVINFMVDTKEIDRIRICKADGDQDRPV